jgi:hypothetical protein
MRARCSADTPIPGKYLSINGRIVLSRSTSSGPGGQQLMRTDLANDFVDARKPGRQRGTRRDQRPHFQAAATILPCRAQIVRQVDISWSKFATLHDKSIVRL